MKGYFAAMRRAGFGALAAKEGMTPDELLNRLISAWRNTQR